MLLFVLTRVKFANLVMTKKKKKTKAEESVIRQIHLHSSVYWLLIKSQNKNSNISLCKCLVDT